MIVKASRQNLTGRTLVKDSFEKKVLNSFFKNRFLFDGF